MRIVVLYNMATPDKSLCPEIVRYQGKHLSAWDYNSNDSCYHWDYYAIKDAIEG